VTVAYTFGRRTQSEVLTLERWHVDLEAGTIRLDPGSTKNDDGRVVYVPAMLQALLAEQLDRVRDLERRTGTIVPSLFPYLSGRVRAGQRCRDFRKLWRQACRAAGVPGKIRHDFRRTAVRNLEQAAVPRSVAMKLTGHKTESGYRRSAIVSDADLEAAAAKLDQVLTKTASAALTGAAQPRRFKGTGG
jgi:integrase